MTDTLTNPSPALSAALEIVDLDRKISRAMQQRRGITLSAAQLDHLAAIGLIDALAKAKAEILTAQAQERRKRGAG